MRINTGCIPDWEATSTRHRQDDLLPMAWGKPEAATPIAKLTDEQLGAYCDEHLGPEGPKSAANAVGETCPFRPRHFNRWADNLQEPDWERIAELANASLDCASWGPPPWAPEQWVTLSMVLSLAEEGAADG